MVLAVFPRISHRDVPQTKGMTRVSDQICAVVVAFEPKPALLQELVTRLLPQVNKILVVDNTPASGDVTEVALHLWASPDDRVSLVRFGRNLGIAAGMNEGIRIARNEGYEYVLLSDQDSRPAKDMVSQLLDAGRSMVKHGVRVGCVCPAFVDLVTGQPVPFQVHLPGQLFYSKCSAEEAVPVVEIITAITSGSLISMDALKIVGPMNEDLFIDYVDTDWCHRARACGLRLFGVGTAKLEHRLGEDAFRVWYLKWRWFNDCSPRRMYFRVRNFLFLCRQDYVPLSWKVRTGWNWLGNIYAYCIYSPRRIQHARWIVKGVLDGLRNKFFNSVIVR